MTQGFFITFEGGEGVGKTTQIKRLEEYLKAQKHDVVTTREPGGTKSAEAIRDLIFASDYDGQWTVDAETLMMFAARSMHIKDIIKPAVNASKTVLCDRFIDSTTVYQGLVKGYDLDFIKSLQDQIIGQYMPNLTIILDLSADIAMERVKGRGADNENDRGSIDFYQNLRQGFLDIAAQNQRRCVIIDANQDIEDIATDIQKIVTDRISAHV